MTIPCRKCKQSIPRVASWSSHSRLCGDMPTMLIGRERIGGQGLPTLRDCPLAG